MAWQDPNKVPIKAFYEGVTNAPWRVAVGESMGTRGIPSWYFAKWKIAMEKIGTSTNFGHCSRANC